MYLDIIKWKNTTTTTTTKTKKQQANSKTNKTKPKPKTNKNKKQKQKQKWTKAKTKTKKNKNITMSQNQYVYIHGHLLSFPGIKQLRPSESVNIQNCQPHYGYFPEGWNNPSGVDNFGYSPLPRAIIVYYTILKFILLYYIY